jgi:hypothetical protein
VVLVRRIRVYADTSVFGGPEDAEFRVASRGFFDMVHDGQYVVLLSTETLRELALSPRQVRSWWEGLAPNEYELVPVSDEVLSLGVEYVRAGVLGQASSSDALHVAAATVAGADLIVSWNFRHIVNFNRIRGFNAVNVRLGYRAMTILSPREVVDDEESV